MCIGSVGTILRLDGHWAEIDFGGVRTNIRIDYLPDITVGERVLVHAGFAISRLSDDEAREMEQAWADLREVMGRRVAGNKA